MSEADDWLETLTEDTLLIERVADLVTSARYQPCRATINQVYGQQGGSIAYYARTLAYFDEGEGLISTYPLRTRASDRFLERKYRWIASIDFEVEDLVSPDDADQAVEVFEALPDGFVKDWRWGLGIHKLYKPVIDMVGFVKRSPEHADRSETLRISPKKQTHIAARGYVLNLGHYNALRLGLYRIQARHQSAALSERIAQAHNTMLSDQDAANYPPRRAPYKPDTIFKIIGGVDAPPRFSKSDRSALVAAVKKRADDLARDEPGLLASLQKTVQIASLCTLIERFEALLNRTRSVERDWQELLRENRFLLSFLFGFPVVLVAEQANVGGMSLDGDGTRYADFLLKNEVTQSAALVELKRPSTILVTESEYAGIRNIAGDLTNTVMQVLDQRFRLLTNLPATLMNSAGKRFEGWFVSCVVIAGRRPSNDAQAKALEIYRNSLKDVVILTFDELLARLISLKTFLESEAAGEDESRVLARQLPDMPPPFSQ